MLIGGGLQRVFQDALSDFTNELPGLRDGDGESIHRARVAIRRLRESLAVVRTGLDEHELETLDRGLTRVFKALGHARDADIAQGLVHHVETRFPQANATLTQLRAAIGRTQLSARRRLIKTLEAVHVETIPSKFVQALRPHRRLFRSDPAREILRLHLRNRAVDMQQAMDRTGGVYFRKRTHAARVAIKQFRYALELAEPAGLSRASEDLRVLRKAQDALGQAHDREVLIKRLRVLATKAVGVNVQETLAVEQLLMGEISDLHGKYLVTRPRIREICCACLSTRRTLPIRASAMALAALTLPVMMARRRS